MATTAAPRLKAVWWPGRLAFVALRRKAVLRLAAVFWPFWLFAALRLKAVLRLKAALRLKLTFARLGWTARLGWIATLSQQFSNVNIIVDIDDGLNNFLAGGVTLGAPLQQRPCEILDLSRELVAANNLWKKR